MNREQARKVADAVLYEGYMLYPYRPSALKNRQRWSFGILYPQAYAEVGLGTERSAMHSECLLECAERGTVQIELRFLHLLSRQYKQPVEGGFEPVSSLLIDGELFESWDEAVERSVQLDLALGSTPRHYPFAFSASEENECLHDRGGALAGAVTRAQQSVCGAVVASSEAIREGVFKLTIHVSNTTQLEQGCSDRDWALLSALLSAHTILTASNAQFVSLLDPPPELREGIQACHNEGTFPVLAGSPPGREMMLCLPIVLYDYPQVAPESASEFCDSTEIDEMLILRTMTLSDEEKQQVLGTGGRVRELLQRTEASAREQLKKTHGTIRGMSRTGEQT